MTTIAIATTRGAELARLGDILAAFYGVHKKSTRYIEPLYDGEASLFSLPDNSDEKALVHIQVHSSDPVKISIEIAAAIRDNQTADGTIVVSLPGHAQRLTPELLELFDLFLIQAIPAQQSMSDAVRLLAAIHGHIAEQKLKVRPWILGAGCAGGPAIAARLRASAALILARDQHRSLRPEDLPILHWGMPLLHWSTWDHICGLKRVRGKPPSRHVGRACYTLFRQTVLLAQRPDIAPTFDELAADSVNFFEPWLIDDTRGLAQRHLDLSEDLSLIESGFGPIPEDFLDTARLEEWGTTRRTFMALEGTVWNHPELTTGDWVQTSEVIAFGPARQWVRTLSRYYTLGAPAEGEHPTLQTH